MSEIKKPNRHSRSEAAFIDGESLTIDGGWNAWGTCVFQIKRRYPSVL